MNYIVYDIENNTSNQYGCKAGCFMFDDIVAVGLNDGKEVVAQYVYNTKFKGLDLEGIDLLIGHNISHDLLFFWKEDWLQDFFKKGGKVWDTQYAEYVLSGHQKQYNSLREIAVNMYNLPERTKWIEDLLFNKQETLKRLQSYVEHHYDTLEKGEHSNVPLEEIMKQVNSIINYHQVSDLPSEKVLEDVRYDVKDTEQVYLLQLQRAEKLGMKQVLELEMDAILATCECRYNGMYINKQIMEENKKKLESELTEEYNKLRQITEKYWKAQ